MPEIIDAIRQLFESIHAALGTNWTIGLIVGAVAVFSAYRYFAEKKDSKVLDLLIKEKDNAIERIGKENQELRAALLRTLGAEPSSVGVFIANPIGNQLRLIDESESSELEEV